jgi:TRAP-type C4-dicarboxylate transport system substrate-binding protein
MKETIMKRSQTREWLAILIYMALALTVLPARAGVEINMATAYAADNFQTQNILQFAEEVKSATNGAVVFKVHPGGTLLKAPLDIYNGVRSGKAQAGEAIMTSLSKEHPIYAIDSLPFIVSNYTEARKMWDASRPSVEKVLDSHGLKLLYAVPWPAQNLYANREIKSMADMKGLTMRAYSPATVRIAELVGAKPVTIQVVDLGKAIAEDKLDLMLTSSWTGVDVKAWSKMRHYYKVVSWIPKNMVFIDKKVFNKLDAPTQRKLLDAAAVAETRGWKASKESDQFYESQLVANKMNVSTMDYNVRSTLDRIGETLAREWLKKAGPDEMYVLLKYTSERSMK